MEKCFYCQKTSEEVYRCGCGHDYCLECYPHILVEGFLGEKICYHAEDSVPEEYLDREIAFVTTP